MDKAIQHYIESHPTLVPLLVISYDMFRIYAEAINCCHHSIEVLFCDEGHRMKNHQETKTNTALQQCVAQRRVILTGTPIQNNLYELYALIQFILPNYLSELIPTANSLSSFKTSIPSIVDPCKAFEEHFIQKISAKSSLLISLPSKTPRTVEEQRIVDDGNHAEQQLQNVLSKILLRRTKEEILAKVLPTRYDYILLISPFARSTTTHDNQRHDSWEESYRKVYETAIQSVPTSISDKGKMIGVLPALMQVRLFCSHGNSSSLTTSAPSNPSPGTLQGVCGNSSKLWTCFYLLRYLRTNRPQEKIIIASNFQETLSTLKQLCRLNHWSTVRIDGSFDATKRQKILQFFQQTTKGVNDACPILLLSTHAGGVGLNITAANHCILCDPDWNPAIDQQTFGRIYREGQSKETFIYRLIVQGSIEETILARQSWKNELIRLLPTATMTSSSSISAEESTANGKKRKKEESESTTDLPNENGKRFRKEGNDDKEGEGEAIAAEDEEEDVLEWLEQENEQKNRYGMPIGNSIMDMVFPTATQCQQLYSKRPIFPILADSSSAESAPTPIISDLFRQHEADKTTIGFPEDYPRFGRDFVLTIHEPTPYTPASNN
jgi:DNA repair and recombination RAD54-like protein